MIRPSLLCLAALSVTALAACGTPESQSQTQGQSQSQGVEERIAEEVARHTGAEPSRDTTPCEILDDALIHRHFEIGDAEISRSLSQYSPHPLCTASWPKPNAAEIEAQRAEVMMERMMRRMQGEEVETPSLRSRDEVSLTISKDRFASRQQALAAFDSAMRILSEGMTVETSAGAVDSPRYDIEPVTGVGEKAMWAPKLHQLSVATAHHVFHVGVRTEGGLDVELEKAKELAREIAAAL